MKRIAIPFLLGLALGALPATAAVLPFTGTLSLDLLGTPSAVVAIPGSGLAQVSGVPDVTAFSLAGGTFGPVSTRFDLGFGTGSDLSLAGVENRSGQFSGGSGTMGLNGSARLCLVFAPCALANVPFPIAATGTPPRGLGIGGTQTTTGGVDVTVQHSGWTVGSPVLTIHNPATTVVTPSPVGGFVHGPGTLTSTAGQVGGVIQLVTVSKVFTSLTAAFPELRQTGVLNLQFIPEPGTLLLFGSGVVALGAGRSRRRR